jgi:hypothetical protein
MLVGALSNAGCSMFMQPPASPTEPADCSGSMRPPLLDLLTSFGFVGTGTTLVILGHGCSTDGGCENHGFVPIGGGIIIAGALLAGSSIYGFVTRAQCEDARRAAATRISLVGD